MKLLHRRAIAYKGLNLLEEALEDLKSPVLEDPSSRALLKEVKSALKARKNVEQQVWSSAFNKTGSLEGSGESESAPPSPTKNLSKEFGGKSSAASKRPFESMGSETSEAELDQEEDLGH